MTDRGWQRIIRLMDEAQQQYLTGMVTLRERVVDDMKRKLKEGGVLDHPRDGATPRSSTWRKKR